MFQSKDLDKERFLEKDKDLKDLREKEGKDIKDNKDNKDNKEIKERNERTLAVAKSPYSKIRWKTDFEKSVITENFIKRKWTESEDDDGKYIKYIINIKLYD